MGIEYCGGLSGTDYVATATNGVTVGDVGAYDIDVTADVQAWFAGTATNYGWFLIGPDVASSEKDFASSGDATAGNWPKLVITYTLPTGRSFACIVG